MERKATCLSPHTSQGSERGLSAPSPQPPTPWTQIPSSLGYCFSFLVLVCFPQVSAFHLWQMHWTGCPRFRACYGRVEPRTPGHQENKGGQPQRRAGVKAGPQEVQSRLYLQEEACQGVVTFLNAARLLAITSSGHHWASFQSVPLGIQPTSSSRKAACW